MGADIKWQDATTLTITAKNIHSHEPNPALCEKIRASILLLGPTLARLGKIRLALPGGDVIGARRIDTHIEGLSALGAKFTFDRGINASLGNRILTDLFLDEPSVTATENIVLLAVLTKGQTIIHNAACEPHVIGLCKLLVKMGAKIEGIGSNRLEISGVDSLNGATHEIDADFMEVGSFLCLAAASKGNIRVKGCGTSDYKFIFKTFSRLGFNVLHDEKDDSLFVDPNSSFEIEPDIGNRTPTVYSGPWPAFPTDLMSVAIVAATQMEGMVLFFEKMFEGRMFFIDKLLSMGGRMVLCDPHRVVVSGKSNLIGAKLSSPDVRAGMALVIAALVAKGNSRIENIYQIERGYADIETKLLSIGAKIKKNQ
jgi:UDP-N-acetylglucosamine 1-carboxyvinyltransferase